MFHRSIVFASLLASSPAVAGVDLPDRAQLLTALNALETSRPPARVYRVHAAHCMEIAPEEGKAAVACRVDLSLDYPDPERDTRHHDSCLRFVRHGGAGDAADWAVVQIRNRPCEMRSRLTRDPNPVPNRPQLERALLAMHTCHDLDGITDCFAQPTGARVEEMRCKSIAPGAEGRARVACRVTGSVAYPISLRLRRLNDICVRLDRYTPADESPAVWGARYVPAEVPCEVR